MERAIKEVADFKAGGGGGIEGLGVAQDSGFRQFGFGACHFLLFLGFGSLGLE